MPSIEDKNMVITFLGDSITEGAGAWPANKRFSTLLCAKLGAKEKNYGLGGSRIARQRVCVNANPDEEYELRLRWMDPETDFLFVFGGVNDYNHGDAPMGEKGSRDPFTFRGAMKSLCDAVLIKYDPKKVCFLLPTYRYDESNVHGDGSKYWVANTLEEYREAMREILKDYPFDVHQFSSLPMPESSGPTEWYCDGLHPNNQGHAALAEELYAYLKDKGIVKK